MATPESIELSVVVPVYNEQDSIALLLEEIDQALQGVCRFEVVVVDDGSATRPQSVCWLRLAQNRSA